MKDGAVTLKVADDKNLPFLVKWANAGSLHHFKRNKKKTNLKTQADLLKTIAAGSSQLFIIQIAGDDTPAGTVEILDVDILNRTCHVSIYIEDLSTVLPTHGYTVVSIVLSYIFKRMSLFKISVEVAADDAATMALLKQHDFKVEVRKRAHLYLDGAYKTILEMALLKHEYDQRKQNQS